jgi:hypothetical protein
MHRGTSSRIPDRRETRNRGRGSPRGAAGRSGCVDRGILGLPHAGWRDFPADILEGETRVSRGLGPIQLQVLEALHALSGSSDLEALAHAVAGAFDGAHPEGRGEASPRAFYKAVARAVTALERRGLVASEVKGYYEPRPSHPKGYPYRVKTVRLCDPPPKDERAR